MYVLIDMLPRRRTRKEKEEKGERYNKKAKGIQGSTKVHLRDVGGRPRASERNGTMSVILEKTGTGKLVKMLE